MFITKRSYIGMGRKFMWKPVLWWGGGIKYLFKSGRRVIYWGYWGILIKRGKCKDCDLSITKNSVVCSFHYVDYNGG